MAVVAKMYVQQVVYGGGGVWVPLCQGKRYAETWPPFGDLGESGMYGHDVADCEDCQRIAYADPDVFCQDHAVRGGAPVEHSFPNDDGEMVGRPIRYRTVLLRGKGREEVRLQAVIKSGDLDDPNNAWAAATPNGHLEITIDNPDAWGFFEPGAEYYVEMRRVVPARGNRSSSDEV